MIHKEVDYGGIVGHKKEEDILLVIRGYKANNITFKKIASIIKKGFGVSPAPEQISFYLEYKDKQLATEQDRELVGQPMFLDDRPTEIYRELYGDNEQGRTLKKMYCKVMAMCEYNINEFEEGKSRLKLELVRQLGDLNKLLK